MKQKKKATPLSLIIFEVIIFSIMAYTGRSLLENLLANAGFSGFVALMVKIILVLALVAAAFAVDAWLTRYLRSRGWME